MLEENKLFSKVFMWMFIGLAITFGVGYMVSVNENMLYNVFSKCYIFLVIAELLVVIWLSARISKMQPMMAKILFCLYSFLTGLTFSSVFVVYHITSIIAVFGITSLLFLIFALIGKYTNIDLTKIGVYLFMILLGTIICSIVNLFVKSEGFDLVLTIICLVVFLIYIAYDVQMIKKRRYQMLSDENFAIYGALQLYLDFINVFLRLLQLFGNKND